MSPYVHLTPRPLWKALAHLFARRKPGAADLPLLNKLYRGLLPTDQVRCRVEILECRAAIRGERLAVVQASVIQLDDYAMVQVAPC